MANDRKRKIELDVAENKISEMDTNNIKWEFCLNILKEKKAGDRINFAVVKKLFRDLYKTCPDDLTNTLVKVANRIGTNYEVIEQDEGVLLAPNLMEIECICENYIKKGNDTSFSEFNKYFFEKYGYESVTLSFTFSRILSRVLPSPNEMENFILTFFSEKKKTGKITFEEIIASFQSKYGINYPSVVDGFIRLLGKSNVNYDVSDSKSEIIILPSQEEIKDFCNNYLLKKKKNCVVSFEEIVANFQSKYGINYPPIVYEFFRRIKNSGVNCEISDSTREIVILPTQQEVGNFWNKYLLKKNKNCVVSFEEIIDSFKSEYGIAYSSVVVDFIRLLGKSNVDYDVSYSTREIMILPSQEEISNFCSKCFLKKKNSSVVTFKEIIASFQSECEIYYPPVIDDFIHLLEKNKLDYEISKNTGKIFFLPSIKERELFLICRLLKNNNGNLIALKEISDSFQFVYGFECNQIIEDLLNLLDKFKVDYELSEDRKRIILNTREVLITFFVDYIQDKNVWSDIRRIIIGEKSQLSCVVDEIICDAIEVVNSELNKSALGYDDKTGSVYEFSRDDYVRELVDSKKCPICEIESDDYISLGEHIWSSHISEKTTLIRRESSNTFRCFHCNESYIFSGNILVRHLLGYCKESKNSSYVSQTIKQYGSNVFAANNPSILLEGSHQIFRENGRFGSYPLEDYHGDGDSSF